MLTGHISHFQATIRRAWDHLETFGEDHALGDMSAAEARASLEAMRKRGMKYVPFEGCDNVNAEGACVGHD